MTSPVPAGSAAIEASSAPLWLEQWRLLGAFVRRNALVDLSYRMQLVTTVLGALVSLATFYFLAGLVDRQALAGGAGQRYFPFVLVGLACAQFSGVAMNGLSAQLRQEQVLGTLEATLVQPIRPLQWVLCLPAWDACWASLQLALYLALGVAFFHLDLSHANWLAAGLVLLASLLALFGLGLLAAAYVVLFKRGNPVQSIVNTTFMLLSGVYFPVALLPAPLRWVAQWLPITHVLQGARRALLDGLRLAELLPSLGLLLIFAAVLLPLGLAAIAWALRRVRRHGTLAAY